MLAQKVVDLRLDHRQLASLQALHQHGIAIKAQRGKSLAGGTDRRAQAEMGHAHIGDAWLRHDEPAPRTASAESCPSTRKSQRSLPRSVCTPLPMSRLK